MTDPDPSARPRPDAVRGGGDGHGSHDPARRASSCPPTLVAAVAAAEAAGITPIIATGRMFGSARPYALQLGITAPVICYQGALIADPVTGEWLRHQPIDVPIALDVIGADQGRRAST